MKETSTSCYASPGANNVGTSRKSGMDGGDGFALAATR